MLIGEPSRTQFDLRFTLLGIPIRVHPFFWLVGIVLGARSPGARELLSWVVALFVSILFHELGHALVMRAYGFRPWITLYGMGGLASYNPSDGSGSKGTQPAGQIMIAFAGPGAGFVLAAFILAIIAATGHQIAFQLGGAFGVGIFFEPFVSPLLTSLIYQILFISIIWGMVNLLPIYPLDGGQIAREILTAVDPGKGIQQSLILSMIAAAAMALLGLVRLGEPFIALMFGYLAYTSYATLQAYGQNRRW